MVVRLTEEFLEEPIASLERYGLNCRVVNQLEDYFGFYGTREVRIRHLQKVNKETLLSVPNLGEKKVTYIQEALIGLYKEMVEKND